MLDRQEARERGQRQFKKRAGAHPFGQLQHRVVDSAAFADLSNSAKVLLMLLVRQCDHRNNGRLRAAFSWARKFGIASEHTLHKAIADLIAHGFLYRTRSHGANQQAATYALTDRPIPDKEGLFLGAWQPDGWRNWIPKPSSEKPTVKECSTTPATSAVSHPELLQEM